MRYIPDALRADLESLADTLLPLHEWVTSPGKHKPPDADDLPWRQKDGPPLNANSLEVIPFIDGVIAETSGDVDLLDRFAKIFEDPLGHSPLTDVHAWRAARGLDSDAAFGVIRSQNVLQDVVTSTPFARLTFYKANLDLFKNALDAARKAGPIDWTKLTDDLWNDASPFWPLPPPGPPGPPKPPWTPPVKSSVFLRQFLKDVLYAVLSMRGPAPGLLNFAVPIELGEHRRPGNKYTPKDTQAAVSAFKKIFAAVAKAPPSPPAVAPQPPPVGSPPATTKPEHLA